MPINLDQYLTPATTPATKTTTRKSSTSRKTTTRKSSTASWTTLHTARMGGSSVRLRHHAQKGRYLLAWGTRKDGDSGMYELTVAQVNSLQGAPDEAYITLAIQGGMPPHLHPQTAPQQVAPQQVAPPASPALQVAPPALQVAPPVLQQVAPQPAPQQVVYIPRDRAPICDEQGRDIRPSESPKWDSPAGVETISYAELMTYGTSRLVGEHMAEAWAMAWWSLIARRPLMIRGLAGGAKTMLSEMMGAMMAGARHSVVQMHPTASAEELLGATSLRGLDYDLIARAFQDAPISAHALLIDEFEKASEPVQQALLSLLAERVLRDAGRTFQLPIESLIATSNDDIYDDAVRDRFTLTAWTIRQTPSAFRRAFRRLTPHHTEARVTSDLLASWRATATRAIASQDDPSRSDTWDAIDGALDHLSTLMSPDDVEQGLSERRTLQLIDLMGACASCHGRDYIAVSDAMVLAFAPPTQTQQASMRDYLRDTLLIEPLAGYAGLYMSGLEEQEQADLEEALRRAQARINEVLG